jgi:hypothetical protein
MRFHLPQQRVDFPGISPSRRDAPPSRARIHARGKAAMRAALFAAIIAIGAGGAPAEAMEKIRLGGVENVVLLPWGVSMPARIDTGAATSSLDARNLTIKGNTVEFNLPQQYGGRKIRLPLEKWKTVKTSEARERRPVVFIEMCIGSKRVRTRVNLNDRSKVKYPLIIGRNTLSRDFVVECSTSYCAEPSCPEVKPK